MAATHVIQLTRENSGWIVLHTLGTPEPDVLNHTISSSSETHELDCAIRPERVREAGQM